ncbi:uncharacterized protein LOC130523554 isoform X2 [Takifugu flavidus]|uniref:AIG1-type G domain-containing protein n=1 Tax=Takifugu flavidus TaxID=433684 RepID=A0A5C6PSS9_9TELE|nr:uncharacterized protein LOC130523554 isoform X2 [Takifugu flavidus]XP_056884870.1 uncharacterized protein LOC130523554 isoform X2 [Takifugu flavidus]XP_056884881.1 uncharacterized protein LOC130523554 isoform X2 [Takifugu flavidus]TWW82056.1 hypothetical protein D4764_01G0018710 [Takifugu flavidus]
MATENSETFLSSIIKKSQLIQSGSPKIYQLNAVTKITEGLKTVTVGTKKVNRLNKTILLLGETGTGKSALINLLVNYAMGVKWEDEVWFKIVEEETTRQSKSQTSDVIMYQIFGFGGKTLPVSLTLVDTPRYGDNRDDTNDDSIAERLLKWFTSHGGVHKVDAVGLVLKASDNRLSDRLRYVFDSVASLFGANMEKNIFALLTHSDGGPPDNALTALADAQIKYAKDEQGDPVYFVFNNRQSDQRTGRYTEALKNAWDFSEDEMKRFMEVLNVTEAQTLRTTVEVINQLNQLKECIINIQDKLKFIELKKTQIDQEKALYIKCEEKMKANENYEEDVDEPYKDKVPIEGGRWWFYWVKGATSCPRCEETCHYKCECTFLNGYYCPIFDGRDHCTVCTNKCEREHHVKEEWIYVPKTRKVRKTYEDIKKKVPGGPGGNGETFEYFGADAAGNGETSGTGTRGAGEKLAAYHQAGEHRPERLIHFHLKHLDFLIESMQDERFAEKVRKLKEMKQRMEGKNLRKALNYAATAGGDKKKQK